MSMNNRIRVTVTQEHLDRAIKDCLRGCSRTASCLMAQALQDKFPLLPVRHFYSFAQVGPDSWAAFHSAQDLVELFDHAKYDALRRLLPTSVVYVKKEW